MIDAVMAIYTEACTLVRTVAGLGESFEANFGLHQGSQLSPLLFALIMDIVSTARDERTIVCQFCVPRDTDCTSLDCCRALHKLY